MAWRMHAGRSPHAYQPGRENELMYFGHRRYVEACGVAEVLEVEVVEDPDGTYLGWIADDKPPTMIQPHPVLYRVQFAYGPEAEEKAGRGRTAHLSVTIIEES